MERRTETPSLSLVVAPAMQGAAVGKHRNPAVAAQRGFTVIDVLVSMSVIAVLISLMLPQISKVNESARRVACQSNLRQIGIGTLMYAQEYEGFLPPSQFLRSPGNPVSRPQEMITLRVQNTTAWDGLGLLYLHGYVDAPEVFYCQSHRGHHRFGAYANLWTAPGEATRETMVTASSVMPEIIGNYHFRGEAPASGLVHASTANVHMTRSLFEINPKEVSIIADGMRVQSDVNHKNGSNYFRADMTVHWYNDKPGRVLASLPKEKELASARPVTTAWHLFDGLTGHAAGETDDGGDD